MGIPWQLALWQSHIEVPFFMGKVDLTHSITNSEESWKNIYYGAENELPARTAHKDSLSPSFSVP